MDMMLSDCDRQAIRETIEQQLIAFQCDDADSAFSLASPEIQAQFRTSDIFINMVKTAYQAVYRPRSVLFADLSSLNGYPVQKVLLMGPEGDLFLAAYLMEQQSGSHWRIAGCFLRPVSDPNGTFESS